MSVLAVASSDAQLVIGSSPGVFTPSFRDPLNTDAGNTTFFGWGPGTGWFTQTHFRFDGSTLNSRIDNPFASQGVGGLTGTLNQIEDYTILASSGNIYSGHETPEVHLSIQVPTNGGVDGFTTIILQGRTAFGGFNDELLPLFGAVGTVEPDVVFGMNAMGQGQFWVKYELPGSAPSYLLDITLQAHSSTSIAELTVDTQWSTTGYAPDTVQAVPEPGSIALLFAGMAPLALRRWRKNLPSAA